MVLGRQAVAPAPTANPRVFALAYLGTALIDAGRYADAANEMLDAIAEAYLTGPCGVRRPR